MSSAAQADVKSPHVAQPVPASTCPVLLDKRTCPPATSALAVAQPVPAPHSPLAATETRAPPCLGYRGAPSPQRGAAWRVEGNICSISQRPAGMIVIK